MLQIDALHLTGGTLAFLLLAGCAHDQSHRIGDSQKCFIRSVRFEGAKPNLKLAEAAREFGDAQYPAILALLGDSKSPRQIDIVFQKNLAARFRGSLQRAGKNLPKSVVRHPGGLTRGSVVYLSFESEFQSIGQMKNTLAHELAHCAQHYSTFWAWGRPHYWTEAIADCAAQKIAASLDPAEPPCRCTGLWPHYTFGYVCGAAFLTYIEERGHEKIVTNLNIALRNGTYSETFFLIDTGKTLEEWWTEFLTTARITNLARIVNDIYAQIGFHNGKLPKDAESRLRAFIARQPQAEHLLDILGMSGRADIKPEDIRTRVLLLAVSLTETGETAMAYLVKLWKSGALPGFPEGGVGSLYEPTNLADLDQIIEADSREILGEKPGNSGIYHFQVIRPCRECDTWEIEKAWRSAPDGQVIERLGIP